MKIAVLAAALLLSGSALAGNLYDDLGGGERIALFTANFVERIAADPRIAEFFKDTDKKHFAERLTEFICQASGDPRPYRQFDMPKLHKGMGVRDRDFNALVEDLQSAMDDAGIPFSTQNRLLAILAPLEREIVQ